MNLTPGQKAKAEACKTSDELLALAKAEGIELTEEQLDAAAGGAQWGDGDEKECRDTTCGTYVCSVYFCHWVTCTDVDCWTYESYDW